MSIDELVRALLVVRPTNKVETAAVREAFRLYLAQHEESAAVIDAYDPKDCKDFPPELADTLVILAQAVPKYFADHGPGPLDPDYSELKTPYDIALPVLNAMLNAVVEGIMCYGFLPAPASKKV